MNDDLLDGNWGPVTEETLEKMKKELTEAYTKSIQVTNVWPDTSSFEFDDGSSEVIIQVALTDEITEKDVREVTAGHCIVCYDKGPPLCATCKAAVREAREVLLQRWMKEINDPA